MGLTPAPVMPSAWLSGYAELYHPSATQRNEAQLRMLAKALAPYPERLARFDAVRAKESQ